MCTNYGDIFFDKWLKNAIKDIEDKRCWRYSLASDVIISTKKKNETRYKLKQIGLLLELDYNCYGLNGAPTYRVYKQQTTNSFAV